jgi:hypothetical protein
MGHVRLHICVVCPLVYIPHACGFSLATCPAAVKLMEHASCIYSRFSRIPVQTGEFVESTDSHRFTEAFCYIFSTADHEGTIITFFSLLPFFSRLTKVTAARWSPKLPRAPTKSLGSELTRHTKHTSGIQMICLHLVRHMSNGLKRATLTTVLLASVSVSMLFSISDQFLCVTIFQRLDTTKHPQ